MIEMMTKEAEAGMIEEVKDFSKNDPLRSEKEEG